MAAGKILVIATSFNGLLGDAPTGSWVEEIASPYYAWRTHGFQVTLASIKGGEVFFDPNSTTGDFLTTEAQAFLKGEDTSAMIKNTKSAADFLSDEEDLNKYDAVFIPGGHGIMIDGPESADLKRIIEYMASKGKIISAVCHGPAGLLSATDASSGESILKGKRATGFSNSEEHAVGKDKVVPFSLEDKMKELGAEFECGPDWSEHVVVDGKLITGQNPQSSRAVAEAVASAILPGIEPQHVGKGEGEGFKARGHPVARKEHHAHGDEKVPTHPQAHMHQWQQSVRQTTHTGPGSASRSGRPDKSYTG